MKNYLAKVDDRKLVVYDDSVVCGEIAFSGGAVIAEITISESRYHAAPQSESDKNIVISEGGRPLFKFKFDYVWGGASLEVDGEDIGLDVTGKFLKPGTRLVDADGNDLVVAVSNDLNPSEISLTVVEEISPILVMATLYYHIYTSTSKTLLTILGAGIGGA